MLHSQKTFMVWKEFHWRAHGLPRFNCKNKTIWELQNRPIRRLLPPSTCQNHSILNRFSFWQVVTLWPGPSLNVVALITTQASLMCASPIWWAMLWPQIEWGLIGLWVGWRDVDTSSGTPSVKNMTIETDARCLGQLWLTPSHVFRRHLRVAINLKSWFVTTRRSRTLLRL